MLNSLKEVIKQVSGAAILLLGVSIAQYGFTLIQDGVVVEGIAITGLGVATMAVGLGVVLYKEEPIAKSKKGRKKK